MSVTIRHRTEFRAVITAMTRKRNELALALAQQVRDAADPPVLTGALKGSVHIETLTRSEAAAAETRAKVRRPKVRFAALRRPSQQGVAYIGWRVIYAPYVERRKPWVRRALQAARRWLRSADARATWRNVR